MQNPACSYFVRPMHGYSFTVNTAHLTALANGILWWPDRRLLCVSDLHLGKSERIARRGGSLLPPYENAETLARLSVSVADLDPLTVICLGDSFDDLTSLDALNEDDHTILTAMMAGRRWVWIEGNHDPGPVNIGGAHVSEYETGPLVFRHIATPNAQGEISGHYHPKARIPAKGAGASRPCFILDKNRVILPAFGAYTGGLKTTDSAFAPLLDTSAIAVLTGPKALAIPLPR